MLSITHANLKAAYHRRTCANTLVHGRRDPAEDLTCSFCRQRCRRCGKLVLAFDDIKHASSCATAEAAFLPRKAKEITKALAVVLP